MILTTSWDDGHPLDLRLAEMLAMHGLPATFYVPVENPERPVMSTEQIRQVAQTGFEIGGHTYHHTRLLNVPLDTAREEIVSGKTALESALGAPVQSFCYVGGQRSPALAAQVRQAGFIGARTSVRYRLWQPSATADCYAMPTTMMARPLTWREDVWQSYSVGEVGQLLQALTQDAGDILKTARRWLDQAAKHGGVWHLWGHSWEIEKFDLWSQLEAVFALAAETRGQARWLTNGQLFAECAAGATVNAPGASIPKAALLGVPISLIDLPEAVDYLAVGIEAGRHEYVCTCPAYTVMLGRDNPAVAAAIRGADLAAPDGMGVVWALELLGHAVGRVYGPDLLVAMCERGLAAGWRHYFYGGGLGVAEAMAAKLALRFPGLKVAGCSSPPFRALSPQEAQAETAALNAAQPDIVWVGLGSPKQDLWCADNRAALQAPLLIGVGAAFDFVAGRVRQAPRWLQVRGLEWVFRLVVEPRRLWRRYLVYNPRSVWLVGRQWLRQRAARPG